MAEPGDAESTLLRGTAIFAAVVTVVLYLFGVLLVGLAAGQVGSGADSTPMHLCRDVPEGTRVDAQQVQFMPPRFRCRTTDGREFTGGVPTWLNPTLVVSFAATVVLSAATVVLSAAAFVQADRRAAART
ncbi:hypothetical protein [Streptomyces sp. NPDC101178]|uniref:hypothetical protein n=1 Tax=Streptomyces sp. NPDC101178 TaxID=3366124 RepID=UPI0037F301E8